MGKFLTAVLILVLAEAQVEQIAITHNPSVSSTPKKYLAVQKLTVLF